MCEEWANAIRMNSAEMCFGRDAVPGSDEKGSPEGIGCVEGDWRGIEVRALPEERRVIEGELVEADFFTSKHLATVQADTDSIFLTWFPELVVLFGGPRSTALCYVFVLHL